MRIVRTDDECELELTAFVDTYPTVNERSFPSSHTTSTEGSRVCVFEVFSIEIKAVWTDVVVRYEAKGTATDLHRA